MNIKKSIFFFVGLAVVILFSAFLINKNLKDPSLTSPQIKFTELKKSLGDVAQGPQIDGTFEFTNTGEGILVIGNVSTSCGCTGAMVDEKKEFQPNETGKIKFTFNTQGRQGPSDKTITVATNDPQNPNVVLTLSCNVLPVQ